MMIKYSTMPTDEKATLVAGFLHEKKGVDVLALDVRAISTAAEAMIIVSATSVRQAQALADNLSDFCSEQGIEYMGMEGYASAQWLLVDLNDVIVHVFQEETRSFFNLEGLWVKAGIIADHREPGSASEQA